MGRANNHKARAMPKTRVLTDEQKAGRLSSPWHVPDRGSLASAALCTVAVLVGSAILFGLPTPIYFDAPAARAAIETLIVTAALVNAAMLVVTFHEGRQRRDLFLLAALTAIGLTDLVFSALPALSGSETVGFGTGPQMTSDALAAVAFAAVAYTPAHRLAGAGLRPLWLAGAAALGMIALASSVDAITGRSTISTAAAQSGIGVAAQHPVLLAEAIFSTAVLLVAAAGFLSRPERNARPLAGATYLLAASRLQYLVLPATAPDWVTARDGLRLAAYALLLVAVLIRYCEARRELTAAKLAAERDRIARDLHDGLAQDLAYIALQGQRLSTELGAEHPLTLAARRAVAASREVIVGLAASSAPSTEGALRDVADELAARFGIDIDIKIRDDAHEPAPDELDPARRDQLVRIVREAIVNAARHGTARHITVVFARGGDQFELRVCDDGQGAEQSRLQARNGHGLHMMRARATALGGEMVARRRTQGGVEVAVTFPRAEHMSGSQ